MQSGYSQQYAEIVSFGFLVGTGSETNELSFDILVTIALSKFLFLDWCVNGYF